MCIRDRLIRLDFIYDMLYDNETYAVTEDSRNIESHFMEGVDPEGKIINVGVGKTKMRRASLLALKSLGIKRGINGVLTKEQFPVYIKKLCVSFGEGGFTNFIYFMSFGLYFSFIDDILALPYCLGMTSYIFNIVDCCIFFA